MSIHTFVISLPESQDRRNKIEARLDKLGVKFEMLEALRGSSLDRKLYPNSTALRDGQLGCAASHLKAYRKCATRASSNFCILEDDAMPGEEFRRVLEYYKHNAIPEGVVVLLSAHFCTSYVLSIFGSLTQKTDIGKIKLFHGGIGCGASYLVNSATAQKMADYRKTDFSFIADSWIHYVRAGALSELWIAYHYPARPTLGDTTIGYHAFKNPVLESLKQAPLVRQLRILNWWRVWATKQRFLKIDRTL